jgi:hypothetical protein
LLRKILSELQPESMQIEGLAGFSGSQEPHEAVQNFTLAKLLLNMVDKCV